MDDTDRNQSLLSAHDRLVRALRQNDAPAIVAIYADDVVFMAPNDQTIYGNHELREWFGEYVSHFTIKQLVEIERHVTLLADWAVLRWCYQIEIHPAAGGERILDEGRVLMIWKPVAGEWRIAQQIWNSTRPIGSGTSRFMNLLKQRITNSGTPDP
jgi:ketosteroid isomerase-like protein